jgi:type I restriction enzyme S subunit
VTATTARDHLLSINEFPPLPGDWSVERFRFLFRESKKRNGAQPVGEMLSVSEYRGVVPRDYDSDEQRRTDEELENYRVVRPKQLAVNTMWLNHLGLGVSDHLGHVSPAYAVYDISKRLEPRYVHHLLRSQFYLKIYLRYLYGIRPNSFQIKTDDWNSIPVIVPPIPIQKEIADFLDRETDRIGQLIEKKQGFIDATEDEFLDRVSLAVTGSLDTRVPKKLSGYPWQPEVPLHWTISRLKFLCARIVDCLHETPEHSDDGEFPSIRTADVVRGTILLDQAKRVSEPEYLHRIQRLEPRFQDIVYTREGERFGLAAEVPENTNLCLGQRMMMFRTNSRVLPRYLMWSLNGAFAYHYLRQDTAGATSPHLNIGSIRNVPIFLPPKDEQEKICRYLDQKFKIKERMISATERTIAALKERRSALITAAVTGQINMPAYTKSGRSEELPIEAQPHRKEVRA